MMSPENPNCRALHETILYFCRERKNNHAIKHIVITNLIEWFIFDASEFDRCFWQNKSFNNKFKEFDSGLQSDNRTTIFYNEIAKPLLDSDDITLECAHFDLSKVEESEYKYIYKLLSPDCLLKQFNPNDANALNRGFYNELLYILGLEETKKGGKKIIGRATNPQVGSLYENIRLKLEQYGKPHEFDDVIRCIS